MLVVRPGRRDRRGTWRNPRAGERVASGPAGHRPYHRRGDPDRSIQRASSGSGACRTGSPRRAPIDVAEAFRDLPGLVLLESARPGRNARWTYLTADPVAVLETPAAGPDPFAVARRARRAPRPRRRVVPADAPPFLGGLVGFLGYDLGGALERLPAIAADRPGPAAAPARAPRLGRRLGPADRLRPGSAGARSTATGGGWRGGSTRSTPGSTGAGREQPAPARRRAGDRSTFRSGLDRARLRGRRRARSASTSPRGDLYQANLTRRLEAPFDGDPWDALPAPADRRPVAVLGVPRPRSGPLTGRPRALLSASPEPFLVGRRGRRRHDRPDQGHPPARPRRRRGPGARPRAAVERQGPRRERDDRRRPAQRPRARLPARAPSASRGCAGSSGRPPSSTSSRP